MTANRTISVNRSFLPAVEGLEQRDLLSTLSVVPLKAPKGSVPAIGPARVATPTVATPTVAASTVAASTVALPRQNDVNPANWNIGEQVKEGIKDWAKAGLFQSISDPDLGRDLNAIGDRIARTSFDNILGHIGNAPLNPVTSDLNPTNWSAKEFTKGVHDWQEAGLFRAPDQLARNVGDAARAARDAAQGGADTVETFVEHTAGAAGRAVDSAGHAAGNAADDVADAADDAADAAGDAADDAADAAGDAANDAADALGF